MVGLVVARLVVGRADQQWGQTNPVLAACRFFASTCMRSSMFFNCYVPWRSLNNQRFPAEVHHRSCCDALCRARNCYDRVRMHTNLKQMLNRVSAYFGKPSESCKKDIFIGVTAELSDGSESYMFAMVSAPQARSGHHPADEIYASMTIKQGIPDDFFNGLVLQLDTLPYVPQLRDKIHKLYARSWKGALKMHNTGEFAKLVYESASDSISSLAIPVKFRVNQLLVQDVNVSTVRTRGKTPGAVWTVTMSQVACPADQKPVSKDSKSS